MARREEELHSQGRYCWLLRNATQIILGYCAEHTHKERVFIFLTHPDSGSFGCKYPQVLTKFYPTVADTS